MSSGTRVPSAISSSTDSASSMEPIGPAGSYSGTPTAASRRSTATANTTDPIAVALIRAAAPFCGNEIPEAGEGCDDGNALACDGCSPACVVEFGCGDGSACGAEECDDGNAGVCDGCSPACVLETLRRRRALRGARRGVRRREHRRLRRLLAQLRARGVRQWRARLPGAVRRRQRGRVRRLHRVPHRRARLARRLRVRIRPSGPRPGSGTGTPSAP